MPNDFGDENNRAFNVCLGVRSNLRFRLEEDPMNTIDEIASRASIFLDEADKPAFYRSLSIDFSAIFGKTTEPIRGFRRHKYRPDQPLSPASARYIRDVILHYHFLDLILALLVLNILIMFLK
ncbi:hypothetical protein BV898_18644 [Hypsibius exemplaris]|uniref:Uncharacterized protein n=1 Tax=Hypsibius exemplaris TaxID=2072580 RepID=A0A9X6NKC1_HYPEX|nr:hypothetical protein BV898_18644 [Hypsibius exemplaris]